MVWLMSTSGGKEQRIYGYTSIYISFAFNDTLHTLFHTVVDREDVLHLKARMLFIASTFALFQSLSVSFLHIRNFFSRSIRRILPRSIYTFFFCFLFLSRFDSCSLRMTLSFSLNLFHSIRFYSGTWISKNLLLFIGISNSFLLLC